METTELSLLQSVVAIFDWRSGHRTGIPTNPCVGARQQLLAVLRALLLYIFAL
jgi:hypothetical protein